VELRRVREAIWQTRLASRDLRRYMAGDRTTRQEIVRDYFFRLARGFTDIVTTRGDFHYHVSTRDQVVGREAFATGAFDLPAMRRALDALGADLSGRTVVDAGANIGTSTVEFIRRYGAARVVAIEPDPENFKLLRLNLVENEIEDRVTALNIALSDRPGTVSMRRSPANLGDHRVTPDGDVQVPAQTLDALIEDGTIPADTALLWMDVQGHEGHVLAGGRSLLNADVPIVMEYWPQGLGAQLADLESLIREHFSTVIDLGFPGRPGETKRSITAAEIASVAPRYPGESFADVILLP
jgi:FkbM family methyltransferase